MMFRISIDKKLYLSSYSAHTKLPIAQSLWQVDICPARLLFTHPTYPMIEIFWCFDEKIEQFLIYYDLEKGFIEVSGKESKSFFSYRLIHDERGLSLTMRRLTKPRLGYHYTKSSSSLQKTIQKAEIILLNDERGVISKSPLETLFLGCHKQPLFSQVKTRGLLEEILPLWHRLAQLIPSQKPNKVSSKLLQAIDDAVVAKAHDNLEKPLLDLFQKGFCHVFIPRIYDEDFLGGEQLGEKLFDLKDPYSLFTICKDKIRSLFFKQEKNKLYILPHLPKQLHQGKMLNIICEDLGILHIEWSKKALRKMIFEAVNGGKVDFIFPENFKRFRIREKGSRKKGFFSKESSISVIKGKTYFLDRFER